jgi:segregation and condensation protein B
MKIVTTPMCEDILKLAGIKEFDTSSNPDSNHADIAVVLSETDTMMKSIKIKINTFTQIKTSVKMLREMFGTESAELDLRNIEYIKFDRSVNRNIKVKVYSNFLRDIVDDLGFTIVSEDPDYLVYPDYNRNVLSDEIVTMGDRVVEIPSHKNAPKDPIKRAETRYKLMEKKLCTKP